MAQPLPKLVAPVATDQPLGAQQGAEDQSTPPVPEGLEETKQDGAPPVPEGLVENTPTSNPSSSPFHEGEGGYKHGGGAGGSWDAVDPSQPTKFEEERKYAAAPLKSFTMKNLGQSFVQGAKEAATGTVDLAKDLAKNKDWLTPSADASGKVNRSTAQKFVFDPADAEAAKAKELYNSGNYVQAAGHGLAAIVPFAGPWAAHLGERAGLGDVGGATGEGLGTALSMKAGSKVAEPVTEHVVKPVVNAIAPIITEGVKAGMKSLVTPNTDLPQTSPLGLIKGEETSAYQQPAFEPYGQKSMEATKNAVAQGRASKVPTTITEPKAAAEVSPLGQAIAEGRANKIPTKIPVAKPTAEMTPLDQAIAEGRAAKIPVKVPAEKSVPTETDTAIAEGRANPLPTKIKPEKAAPSDLDQAIAEGRAAKIPVKSKTDAELAIAEGKANKLPTKIKPLGEEESPLGTMTPEKPITPADVQSTPGTSMAKPKEEPPAAPVEAAKPAPVAPKEGVAAVEPTEAKPKSITDMLEPALAGSRGTFTKEAADLEKRAAENGRKELPREGGERRKIERTPEEKEIQDLWGRARKELGEGATSDQLAAKVVDLKRAAPSKTGVNKFSEKEIAMLKGIGATDADIDKLIDKLKDTPKQSGESTPEDVAAKAEEHVTRFTNNNLKKFAKDLGLDPDKYDFSKREPFHEGGQKHPKERIQLIKDVMKNMPDDEKTALGKAGDEDKQFWEDRDQSQKSKAERSESYSPRLQKILEAEKAGTKAEGAAAGAEAPTAKEGENSRPFAHPESSTTYGKENKLVSEEQAKEAAKNLKDKMTRSNMGLDPTMLADAAKIGAYHLEAGLREFGEWSKEMVKSLGEAVRPHLEDLWSKVSPNAPTFYSKAERVINEKVSNNASGESILSTLRNAGVKEGEIQWTGLDEFLKDKPKVSKADLQSFIKDNQIQLKEVNLGNASKELVEKRARAYSEQNNIWYDTKHRGGEEGPTIVNWINSTPEAKAESIRRGIISPEKAKVYQRFDELGKQIDDLDAQIDRANDKPTKFEQYTLPGEKQNYTEKLLTLPDPIQDRINELYKKKEKMSMLPSAKASTPEALAQWDEWGREIEKLRGQQRGRFQSSHFDEPNILAHVRYDDRVDPEGNKVLFVEEVQSDWHQKGKQQGYNDPTNRFALGDQISELDKRRQEIENLGANATEKEKQEWADIKNTLVGLKRTFNASQRGVPNAPFKSDWHELAMKRMLREAAEKGYDKLAWTTGDQQAERYDLSKEVSRIDYFPMGKTGEGKVIAYDHDGEEVLNKSVKEAELPDYIGKDAANKLLNSQNNAASEGFLTKQEVEEAVIKWQNERSSTGDLRFPEEHMERVHEDPLQYIRRDELFKLAEENGWTMNQVQEAIVHGDEKSKYNNMKSVSGLDLKMGGEWAKRLYDQAIPNFMNKYGKKWGAKVSEGALKMQDRSDKAGKAYVPEQKVHTIDITPAMKKSVLKEGQPIAKAELGTKETAA